MRAMLGYALHDDPCELTCIAPIGLDAERTEADEETVVTCLADILVIQAIRTPLRHSEMVPQLSTRGTNSRAWHSRSSLKFIGRPPNSSAREGFKKINRDTHRDTQ